MEPFKRIDFLRTIHSVDASIASTASICLIQRIKHDEIMNGALHAQCRDLYTGTAQLLPKSLALTAQNIRLTVDNHSLRQAPSGNLRSPAEAKRLFDFCRSHRQYIGPKTIAYPPDTNSSLRQIAGKSVCQTGVCHRIIQKLFLNFGTPSLSLPSAS